jgi:hypothetical protein
MKMITALVVCTLISGCSAFSSDQNIPQQTFTLEEEMYVMSRHETIDAIKECETSGLRAVPIWGKRKINGATSSIVVDVTCAPKWMR